MDRFVRTKMMGVDVSMVKTAQGFVFKVMKLAEKISPDPSYLKQTVDVDRAVELLCQGRCPPFMLALPDVVMGWVPARPPLRKQGGFEVISGAFSPSSIKGKTVEQAWQDIRAKNERALIESLTRLGIPMMSSTCKVVYKAA